MSQQESIKAGLWAFCVDSGLIRIKNILVWYSTEIYVHNIAVVMFQTQSFISVLSRWREVDM